MKGVPGTNAFIDVGSNPTARYESRVPQNDHHVTPRLVLSYGASGIPPVVLANLGSEAPPFITV